MLVAASYPAVRVAESYATLKDLDKSDFLISFYDSWAILLFIF